MKNQNQPAETPSLESGASNPPSDDVSKTTSEKETTQTSPGLLKPLATFFMAFATVMTVLIVYMDNTGELFVTSHQIIFKSSFFQP